MLRLLTVLLFVSGTYGKLFAQNTRIDDIEARISAAASPRERADMLIDLSYKSYDYDAAKGFAYANRAQAEAEKAAYPEGLRSALTLKGFYYHDIGEYKRAISYYRSATKVPIPPDERLGYAFALMANTYRTQAVYDSAEFYYKNSITLLEKVKAVKTLAYAYRNAARLYIYQWKNAEAEQYLNSAMKIYDSLNAQFGKADVYFAMAELNMGRSKYRLAQEQIEAACGIANAINDDYLKLYCLIYQGEIRHKLGDFLEALDKLLNAAQILSTRNNPQLLTRVYGDLGELYENLSQNEVAMRYFMESIKIAERLGLKYEVAFRQADIAWMHKNQRNFAAAFEYVDKSLKTRTEIGDIYGVSSCHNIRGIIYLQQKKYADAIKWIEKSMDLRKKINHIEGVAACMYNLGLVYEGLKQYDKSLRFQMEALKVEKEIGNKFTVGIAYSSIASVLTYMQKYDSARHYLILSEELGRQTGSVELQMENAFYWSEFYELSGNAVEALRWHKRYSQLNDSVYYESSATKVAQMQALYESDQKDKEIRLLNQEKQLQSNQIQLQEARINLQGFVIIFIIVGFVLVSLLAYKSYRFNKEIRRAHEEILMQKEEIQAQADELQKAYQTIAESHRELEAKVEERTSALREAYKELDTFFYRASHDFRRPLTTFLGLVEVANITVRDAEALELFKKVEETAVFLDKMLFKLQSISDLGSQQLHNTAVDIPQIFSEVVESFKDVLEEKGIRTYTSCILPEKFVSYPALIQVVIENLVENSIAFCRYEKAYIRLRAVQDNGQVIIEVEDNGDGIDKKYHSRIFEMYFRGNERSRGNGLGLYIVKKATEKLGGTLEFQSERDKGTIFRLKFPIHSKSLHSSF